MSFTGEVEKTNMTWTTEDEKRFIDRLGACQPLRATTNRIRKARLLDYLRATKLRSEWGSIDKKTVCDHARARLGELTLRIEQYPHIP